MLPVRGAEHCNMKNSCSHSHRSHSSSVCQRYYQRHCFPRPVHRLSHDSLMYVSFAKPEESCCSSRKTKTVEIANSRKKPDTVQIPYTHKTMMLLWSRITQLLDFNLSCAPRGRVRRNELLQVRILSAVLTTYAADLSKK